MNIKSVLILAVYSLGFSLTAFATLPDLTYPGATASSDLEHETYDHLAFMIKGKGYIDVYGSTQSQDFKHANKMGSDGAALVESFFTEQLGLTDAVFQDGFLQFERDDVTCYLKLKTFSSSYSYTLLRETTCPNNMTLPFPGEHAFYKNKVVDFPRHDLIPYSEGCAISRARYFEYDEIGFRYNRKLHTHNGQYWNINFSKIADNEDSYRYLTAHDYKRKVVAMGAEILEDNDNSFVFRLGRSVASFGSDNSSFGLKIVQEEVFEQTLVLTPDAIKTKLDKTGKITLDGIYFDFNKSSLKPESQKAILSAVALMQRYSDLVLSIHGHTDNKGSKTYNAQLSTDRAAAVMDAIVGQGIEAERLHFKGHGEDDPIATNDTAEGRTQNRRVVLHKESGGNDPSIITIDFVKPIENSVLTETYTYQESELGIQYTQPFSDEKLYKVYPGTHKTVGYEIIQDGKLNTAFSRKAIIKNYENILDLYNAKIVGHEGSTLYFEIADRGDGKKVYGRIEGYDGSYTIRFLIPQEEDH